MFYIFSNKNICLIILFLILCTISYPSSCYIISSNGFVISDKHIYRYPFKTNTLLKSQPTDSSNENINTNDSEDNNSEKLENFPNPSTNDDIDSINLDSTQSNILDSNLNPEKSKESYKYSYDQYYFDPEKYKKIVESFSLFKGPSYSLSEYNKPLPEGCRTMIDFLEIPRNYDFLTPSDIGLGIENIQTSYNDEDKPILDLPEEKRMEGPYPKSAYETIGNISESIERRYTTREKDEETVEPEKMYEILKAKDSKKSIESKKNIIGEYVPYEKFPEMENEDLEEDKVPLSRIHPNYFMFDHYGYLQYYLRYLNDYNYDVFSYHNKNEDKPTFYMNHEYIKKIEKPFPPDENHTNVVREYFLSLIPWLMDKLVDYIKNDPNKNLTPSPPFHDLSLLENFKLPEYFKDDYKDEGEINYEMYSDIKGLHDPQNNLIYPYCDRDPLWYRLLLSTYLEIYNTNDLGPTKTYKKYFSKSKHLKTTTFPEYTKLPKADSEFNENEDWEEWEEDMEDEEEEHIDKEVKGKEENKENNRNNKNNRKMNLEMKDKDQQQKEGKEEKVFSEIRTKLYEQGKKKRGKAMVYIEPGNGHIIINNRDGYQYVYYNEFRLREILEPLSRLFINTKFNIVAKVQGGGISGQSVAIRHALVRYLYRILSPKLKPVLRKFDLVSIDSRRVERKKTNLRKARKKEHYSKR